MDDGTQKIKTIFREMRRDQRNARAFYWDMEDLAERLDAVRNVLASHLSIGRMRGKHWRRWLGRQIRMTRRNVAKIEQQLAALISKVEP